MDTGTCIKFRKPLFDLRSLFGLLFVLLSVGTIVLLLVWSIGTTVAGIIASSMYVAFFGLIAIALADSRYIYIEKDVIKIKYRLKMKADRQITISELKAFFPYTYHFTAKGNSGNMYGVILIFRDGSRMVFRIDDARSSSEKQFPEDIDGLIEILKSHNIKNLNRNEGYSLTENFFSMSFRQREYIGLDEALAFEAGERGV